MANITETYRKPLMSDETGKAIAAKLGSDSVIEEAVNISEQYRKPLMTDETAQEILAKIEGGSGGDDSVTVTFSENNDVITCDTSITQIDTYFKEGKKINSVCNFELFGGNHPFIINNGYIQYDSGPDDNTIGYLFCNLIFSYNSSSLYYTGLVGRIVDNQDVWERVQPVWDNT